MTKTVEEGSSFTLPCMSADKDDDYDERNWYDGRFDDDVPANLTKVLFRQNENGSMVIEKGNKRGMSIKTNNFSLGIEGAKLKDNGTYTCHIKPKKRNETWDNLDLQLYSEYHVFIYTTLVTYIIMYIHTYSCHFSVCVPPKKDDSL